MYTHVGLHALIDISPSVSSGMPNGPFDTQDMFGTRKAEVFDYFQPYNDQSFAAWNLLTSCFLKLFLKSVCTFTCKPVYEV